MPHILTIGKTQSTSDNRQEEPALTPTRCVARLTNERGTDAIPKTAYLQSHAMLNHADLSAEVFPVVDHLVREEPFAAVWTWHFVLGNHLTVISLCDTQHTQ